MEEVKRNYTLALGLVRGSTSLIQREMKDAIMLSCYAGYVAASDVCEISECIWPICVCEISECIWPLVMCVRSQNIYGRYVCVRSQNVYGH